jgi:hypothetical protein
MAAHGIPVLPLTFRKEREKGGALSSKFRFIRFGSPGPPVAPDNENQWSVASSRFSVWAGPGEKTWKPGQL